MLMYNSFQRLAADIGKSAESLRTWGVGEGDDLGVSIIVHTVIFAKCVAGRTFSLDESSCSFLDGPNPIRIL